MLLAIKCTECGYHFYKQDFENERLVDQCSCGNVKVGTKIVEHSIYPWYITLTYNRERPEIYETEERVANGNRQEQGRRE